MVDDNHKGEDAHPKKPLETRPRYQRIDHGNSRQRADAALSYRQPTEVSQIRERLKSALKQKVVLKSFAPAPATPAATSAPAQHSPSLKVSPLPEPAANKPVETRAAEKPPTQDDQPAKPIMSENGFQIFKPNKPEDIAADENSIENIAASLSGHADDQISKTVDPVPMGSDAIEEALKLIEDQPAETESTDEKEPDIGFIPANINPGVFGSTSPSSEDDQAEDDTPMPQDDEQIISDLLNEEGPVISSMPSHDEGQEETISPLHLVETSSTQTEASHDEIPAKDKIQNWQIGQAIASSIRHIVKDEVDLALDRMAREAVRDALRANGR